MSHLAELVASAKAAINQASDVAALDNVRVEYLGKKGHLTLQMTTLRELPPEERPAAGAVINEAGRMRPSGPPAYPAHAAGLRPQLLLHRQLHGRPPAAPRHGADGLRRRQR